MKVTNNRKENPDQGRLNIPGLDREKKLFKVPDGYFDNLPGRIEERIHEEEITKKTRSNPRTLTVLIPLLAAAALVVAYFLIIPFADRDKKNIVQIVDSLNPNNAFDASYTGDLLIYDYQLTDNLLTQLPADTEIDFITLDSDEEAISDEAIVEYLNDQDLDTELLAEL
jgi:hypothetical protein